MTKSEKAKALYAGKKFYIKNLDGSYTDATDSIYYAVSADGLFKRLMNFINRTPTYKYIQVIDGKPVRAFYEDEIFVTRENV